MDVFLPIYLVSVLLLLATIICNLEQIYMRIYNRHQKRNLCSEASSHRIAIYTTAVVIVFSLIPVLNTIQAFFWIPNILRTLKGKPLNLGR